jgi:transposase
MTQRTKATLTTPLTVGIDIGDRTCEDCVLNAEGDVVERKSFATTTGALRKRYELLRTTGVVRVALEVGSHSPWISRLLGELGFEVYVANAHKVQLISRSQKKTDRGDSELLARLCRVDPSLLSPIQHRGPQAQADLALVRARNGLVAARTQLINQVRGSVKPWGIPEAKAFIDRKLELSIVKHDIKEGSSYAEESSSAI